MGQPNKANGFYCRSLDTIPLRRDYLQLPPQGHRCLRTPNGLERLFRQLRPRTKRMSSFEPPVHLEPMLLGIVMQSPWIQLPIQLQPLLTPDTIL